MWRFYGWEMEDLARLTLATILALAVNNLEKTDFPSWKSVYHVSVSNYQASYYFDNAILICSK